MVVRMRETKKAFGGISVPSEIRFTGRLLVILLALVMLGLASMIPFGFYLGYTKIDIDFNNVEVIYILGLLPWAVALIFVFFIWIYKSAKNKYYITGQSLRSGDFIGPKMSVAYFFIPILNFYKPYFIVKEIWEASNDENHNSGKYFPTVILAGWMFYLMLYVVGKVFSKHEFESLAPYIVSSCFAVLTYVLLMYIFLKLTNDQLRAISQTRGLPFRKLRFPLFWILIGFVLMMSSIYILVASDKKSDEQMLKEAYMFYGGENANLDRAFRYFNILADRGNGEGAYRQGECYEYGYGVEADAKKAFDSYLKGAQSGNADAQNAAGMCYYEGVGISTDLREALRWFRDSARQNQITACSNLGYIYSNRDEVLDLDEARKFYLKAAKLGDSSAKFELYKLMLEDDPASENSKEAVEWLKKAAEDNDIDAVNVLGVLYYEGVYVEEDDDKAVELLSRAAKTGYPAAKYNLGYICFYDENLKDDAKAYEYLKAAADGEYESAYILLSRFYAEGIVAEKDVAKAVELLEKAGDNPEAYFRLGIVYEAEGDAAKSKEWLQKAADMGHEKAAEKLRAPDKELGQ